MIGKIIGLTAALAVGACADFTPGPYSGGLRTTSGYYLAKDADGDCIQVESLNGISQHYAGVLRARLATGARLCRGSEWAGPMAYAWGPSAPVASLPPLPNGLSKAP